MRSDIRARSACDRGSTDLRASRSPACQIAASPGKPMTLRFALDGYAAQGYHTRMDTDVQPETEPLPMDAGTAAGVEPGQRTFATAEVRVLGVLIEKEFSTPDHYPLTLNALVAGCNQRSNRDPVLHLGEREVVVALDGLKDHGLAWSVAQAGSRVPKYRHSFTDVFAVCPVELAILCELMLRGAQTISELRARAGRMTEMATQEVEEAIHQLEQHSAGALAGIAPRRHGQRGERYSHTLSGPMEEPELAMDTAVAEPARRELIAENSRLEVLEERVGLIEDRLDQLLERFDAFATQFE